MYQGLIIFFTVMFGLVFGSFLNVCIYRIPKNESIVFGRSHCMSCGKQISSFDLIPVASYLILRGKCRNCGARISPRYPAVEVLNAALWAAALLRFGYRPETILYMAFLSGLIVLSLIDIDEKIVPNGMILYFILIGLISCFFRNGLTLWDKLLGVAAAGVPLLLILLISRGGMGGGDVEFAAAAGLLLGWKLSLFALFAAVIMGGIFGAALMIFKHKSGKSEMPFIPFLAGGAAISLFFGTTLLSFYMTTMRLSV